MTGVKARWLIAAAVEPEIRGIRAGVHGRRPEAPEGGNVWEGQWRGEPLHLLRTGVGPKKAREGVSAFLARHPCRGIVSTGYAGGLQDSYKLGDFVLPAEVMSIPPMPEARFRPDPELRDRVLRAARPGPWAIHTGRMITSDRVIFSSEEKRRLGLEYDAGSVEMESAVIAELAERASVPFVVVRVVLDEASFSLPDLLEVLRWWRRKELSKLIPFVALHPKRLLELMRLLERSRRASRCLTELFLAYLLNGLVNGDHSRLKW